MPTVTFSRKGRTASLLCRVDDDAGNPVFQQSLNPNTKAGQRRLCTATGVGLSDLLPHIVTIEDGGSVSFVVGVQDAEPCEILIRGIRQPRDAGRWVKAETPEELIRSFIALADYPSPEPVGVVSGSQLVFLDIDFHTLPYDQRPTEADLSRMATTVRPSPLAGWVTHGRGYKAVYVVARGFTAEELAACAGISWLTIDGRSTVEIKSETRHPGYPRGSQQCGPVVWSSPSDDLSAVGRWLARSVDPEARDEHLAEQGWQIGQKFDHARCLIAPGASSHAEPVVVMDGGLYCHSCSAHGRAYPGQRKPGFVPWSALIGGIDSRLYRQAYNCVHWSHARHVLRAITGLPEAVLRPAYSATLKLLHGVSDPRIKAVFATLDVMRISGRWVKLASQTALPRDAKRILEEFPATWTVRKEVDGTYSTTARKSVVEDFSIPSNDLREYGYYDLHPVHGVALWGQHLTYPAQRLPFIVHPAEVPESNRPRYLPRAERMSRVEYTRLIERALDGLDWKLLIFYIVARGFKERGGNQQPPMLLLVGPSGSGKSSYAHLAAAVVGDKVSEITYTSQTERLWQQIKAGSRTASYVNISEIFKLADAAKMTPRQAVDFILNMTTDTISHELYTGPTAFDSLPVVTFNDTGAPLCLAAEKQLARRLHYYRLGRRVDWKASLNAVGIDSPKQLRHGSRELAHALDSFLSDVVDDYLSEDRPFDEIAESLGIHLLEKSQEFTQSNESLREFVELLFKAPPLTGSYKERYPHPGWKMLRKDYPKDDQLSELWLEHLADDRGAKWMESRLCSEASWDQILEVPGQQVYLDVRQHRGSLLFMRFRTGPFSKPTAVNEEIIAGVAEIGLAKLRIVT